MARLVSIGPFTKIDGSNRGDRSCRRRRNSAARLARKGSADPFEMKGPHLLSVGVLPSPMRSEMVPRSSSVGFRVDAWEVHCVDRRLHTRAVWGAGWIWKKNYGIPPPAVQKGVNLRLKGPRLVAMSFYKGNHYKWSPPTFFSKDKEKLEKKSSLGEKIVSY